MSHPVENIAYCDTCKQVYQPQELRQGACLYCYIGELEEAVKDQKRELDWYHRRGLTRAVAEVAAMIEYHLVAVPSGGPSVEKMTRPVLMNLAKHIVGALDEFGRNQ